MIGAFNSRHFCHNEKCDRNEINCNVCKCIDPNNNNKYITSYNKLPTCKELNLLSPSF